MALGRVELTQDVFNTCVCHALTTEKEEIMGLLLGDVVYDESGQATAKIWVAMPQIRTDRRKDRVEASPEQLAQASSVAEQLSESHKRTTRVVGWYHSHPHITVFPSHVDVRTQAMYQNLDEGFIGLIFSVFNQDGDKTNKIQMTAFQSMQQSQRGASFSQRGSWDFDSSMAAAIAASMADAKAAAARQGQWIQRRVPIAILPTSSLEPAAVGLADLCRVLFQEERQAFHNALQDATDSNGDVDPLTAIHQAAEYQQHLSRLIELIVSPALQSLRTASHQAQWQQQQLRDLRDAIAVTSPSLHASTSPHAISHALSEELQGSLGQPRSPSNPVEMSQLGFRNPDQALNPSLSPADPLSQAARAAKPGETLQLPSQYDQMYASQQLPTERMAVSQSPEAMMSQQTRVENGDILTELLPEGSLDLQRVPGTPKATRQESPSSADGGSSPHFRRAPSIKNQVHADAYGNDRMVRVGIQDWMQNLPEKYRPPNRQSSAEPSTEPTAGAQVLPERESEASGNTVELQSVPSGQAVGFQGPSRFQWPETSNWDDDSPTAIASGQDTLPEPDNLHEHLASSNPQNLSRQDLSAKGSRRSSRKSSASDLSPKANASPVLNPGSTLRVGEKKKLAAVDPFDILGLQGDMAKMRLERVPSRSNKRPSNP